jgi:hypothetical protein
MKTLYDQQIEEIEDIYAKSLLTAKALKQDMDRLERAVPVAARNFRVGTVHCTIHTYYKDMQIYPASFSLGVSGGSDDDLLKLLLDLTPVLVPQATDDVVVKVEAGNKYFNEISIAARVGNKFYIRLRPDEFPHEWLLATVDRYHEIARGKHVFIGVDLAKSEETAVAS